MDEREMKFVALMRKMGMSKSDPTWTALEIVWDEAWAEAKGPTPLRDDGFDNEDKPGSWSAEEWNLGRWLSAALDDQNACPEFKEDIERWLRSLPGRTTPDREAIIEECAKEADYFSASSGVARNIGNNIRALKVVPTTTQPFSLTEDDSQEGVAFQYANELVAKRLRGDKGDA